MVELHVPTRTQFQALCGKDDRLIRWFEKLAKLSGDTTPAVIVDTEISASSAMALAREAAASITKLEIQTKSNGVLSWLTIP